MTIDYDLKGKFFTDIVQKEAVEARIMTTNQIIEGKMHIRPTNRVKDELEAGDIFLPITDAVVFDVNHNEVFRTSFLAVSKSQIVWVTTFKDIKNWKK
jgi:hypothetical protein